MYTSVSAAYRPALKYLNVQNSVSIMAASTMAKLGLRPTGLTTDPCGSTQLIAHIMYLTPLTVECSGSTCLLGLVRLRHEQAICQEDFSLHCICNVSSLIVCGNYTERKRDSNTKICLQVSLAPPLIQRHCRVSDCGIRHHASCECVLN